ncbi:hypothetical protein EDB85DRAFT_1891779 [Lactarius pseudohatsudake]|nr:hypothetical protein EDB85DRAFT_1891779 [Lactarius pseudohatsudake]
MSTPAGIMTTQIPKSDQVHLVTGAKERSVSLVFDPIVGYMTHGSQAMSPSLVFPSSRKLLCHLIMDVLQRLENTESSAIPAVTESLRINDPGMVPTLLREVAEFKSHMDGTSILGEVHRGGGVISQTHVDQDVALQRDNLALTSDTFDTSRREINPESMQCHAKLQSVLQRVMELERRLGVARGDDKSLRRERIQLGLEVSVAGKRGVWASEFPFMMVLLALMTVFIPNAYKYSTTIPMWPKENVMPIAPGLKLPIFAGFTLISLKLSIHSELTTFPFVINLSPTISATCTLPTQSAPAASRHLVPTFFASIPSFQLLYSRTPPVFLQCRHTRCPAATVRCVIRVSLIVLALKYNTVYRMTALGLRKPDLTDDRQVNRTRRTVIKQHVVKGCDM